MSTRVNFNSEKEIIKLEDITTGCYTATYHTTQDRLIFVRYYECDKAVIMVFDTDGEIVATYENVADAFKAYNNWREASIIIEVD